MTENRRKTGRVAEQRRPMGRTADGSLHALLALLIVLLGIAGTITFIKFKKPPERAEKDVQAPLVKVEQLHVKDIPMVVRGYGVVNPKVEVDIVPEVAGKVVSIHPEFKVGGLIRAGEQILQIDPRDHESAVRQAAAAVEDAKVKLDTEQAEADVARKEWSDLHPGVEPTSPLVLREPQIRKAQAALESAQAQLATAKLRLERTSLLLPFDALIISEKVDLGQYVVTGQSLAKAYGTEAVEIEVPLEDDELAWFDVFENSIFSNGNGGPARTTPAEVRANFAGAEHIWQGRVVRTTGQVDRTSRMVFIVVEVSDPLRVSGGRPPLLPGVFAEVMIEGKTLGGAVAVPRDAIREGNQVWLVSGDRLHIQPLDVVRADKDFAYVVSGVQDEALVVTSSLDTVVDGMKVRLQTETAPGAGQAGQDAPEPNKQEEDK
jgi:RND family efflux transporter MFP subunit